VTGKEARTRGSSPGIGNTSVACGKHRVLDVRPLTGTVFVVTIDRGAFRVHPGQHVTLGVGGSGVNREYSIYTITPDALEFLVKIRPGSFVSEALRRCEPGAPVDLAGPFGAFTIPAPDDHARRYCFVASGVGIAPFHCFVAAYPALNYQVLHGVRLLEDRYDFTHYQRDRYTACVSREDGGDFRGRVTAYLEEHTVDPETCYYICGNNVMVSESYDLLRRRGVPSDNLHTEVFF
jgi:ferredoxin-NADP reductase